MKRIGARKWKSVFALCISFVIWQFCRIFLPNMEVHPLFAYIYSVMEMRDTVDKTVNFGKRRIKATFIGLIIGLIGIAASLFLTANLSDIRLTVLIEFIIIALCVLLALCVAQYTKCENFCGIATIIVIICIVEHRNDESPYIYAIMRTIQTIMGVIVAWFVNAKICPPEAEKIEEEVEVKV